jgi:hypothetical protein
MKQNIISMTDRIKYVQDTLQMINGKWKDFNVDVWRYKQVQGYSA